PAAPAAARRRRPATPPDAKPARQYRVRRQPRPRHTERRTKPGPLAPGDSGAADERPQPAALAAAARPAVGQGPSGTERGARRRPGFIASRGRATEKQG